MSRLTDLIAQVKAKDPQVGLDLEAEFRALSGRRSFGLNFERHKPEEVDLPGRPIRRGDQVRILPARGSSEPGDQTLWKVVKTEKVDGQRVARLQRRDGETVLDEVAMIEDLVVVAAFGDPIYPGLVETGKVERGGADDPYHTVVNAENYHALRTLTFTHRGKVDCIYIDPPYNTRDKDWKYNNHYVDSDDLYRHSKWLAFMERRLKVARELLNPEESTLIVTIDEKEVHRLALLLEQMFPEAKIQMVSVVINPKGTSRPDLFSRVEEHVFFVLFGAARVPSVLDGNSAGKPVRWRYLRREDLDSVRGSRPRQFYPVFVSSETSKVVGVGRPLALQEPLDAVAVPSGTTAVYPVREDGLQMEWGLTGPALMKAAEQGFVRATPGHAQQPYIISYLTAPNIKKVLSGELLVTGTREDGSKIVVAPEGKMSRPVTVWRDARHSAGDHGTKTVNALLPGRAFPFPKSLYAVEDCLRLFVAHKPKAVVVDFFSGSGTTAHAVMRLNKQDGGRRQCISVTNNEVSADEQTELSSKGLRPGDAEWEAWGICDYITKPRIEAAIQGRTPEGKPITATQRGKKARLTYAAPDPFPMDEGFQANARFFTLTYETPISVSHNRAFARIAPLLWLRAGATGKEISTLPEAGWEVVDTYGLLVDLDCEAPFIAALADEPRARMAFIVTDDAGRFEAVSSRLPEGVEPVRLYESYLTNLSFLSGE